MIELRYAYMPNIFFYHGEETFLVDEAVSRVKNQHQSAQCHVFENQCLLPNLIEITQATGLFASTTLVLLKNPECLTKTLSKEDTQQWLDLFKSLPETTTLVIYSHSSVDLRKKLASTLSKTYTSQKFEPFKDWEDEKFLQWLKSRISLHKKTITPEALAMLGNISNKNLHQCANDLINIVTYMGERTEMTLEDIKAMCSTEQSTLYKLTESIKKRNYQDCFKLCQLLKTSGEEPIKLIGLLAANFRLFTQLLLLQNQSEAQIAKTLGKHPFFIKQTLTQIKKTYTLAHLKTITQNLAKLDYEIKSGKINPSILFSAIPKTICLS
jgi:DNA polymerase-3 subunit delta